MIQRCKKDFLVTYFVSHLLKLKIAIMYSVLIVFLSSIVLSFSKLENQDDKSAQLYPNYKNNDLELNGSNVISNISHAIGDETMRSVMKILTMHKQSQEKSIELHRRRLNNTVTSDQSYIIFNRVAKSGSETLRSVLSMLSKKNNFTMVRDRHSESILSEEQRRYFFHLWKGSEIEYSTEGKKNKEITT